jgi:hypothetical protein
MAAGIVAAVLLAPTSVAAQDDEAATEADAMAPAVVTGTVRVVGPNQSPKSEPASPPIVVAMSNDGWTVQLATDDPRLSGKWEVNHNYAVYDGAVKVITAIGHLANEGGSWATESHGFSPGGGGNLYANYYTGEDGYEGLSAMLLMRPAPGGWEVQGVIAPGAWPEPPEWVLPPPE